MKISNVKYLFCSLIWFSLCTPLISFAAVFTLVVPFQNIYLNPGDSIVGNYAFGPHKIVFCYSNDLQTVGTFTWPYQGQTMVSQLPIFLKLAANIQGEFADPFGTLTFLNTQSTFLIVSCDFGF